MSREQQLSHQKPKNKPRRAWLRKPRLQYSISTLLLLTTILALWLGHLTNKARKQRAAVAALSAIGTEIHYDWEFRDGIQDCNAMPPGPEWLRSLIGDEYFQEVVEVSFRCLSKPVDSHRDKDCTSDDPVDPFGSNEDDLILTKDHLNHLNAFPHLRSLDIAADCPTFPPEFWNNFPHLESFSLSDGYIDGDEVFGDQELCGISALKELTYLHLLSEGISGASLKEIGELRKLDTLWLVCGEVRDEDLAHLGNLKNLRHLELMVFNVEEQIKGHGLGDLPVGLEYLVLDGFPEDCCLKHLRHLHYLYELKIENEVITDEGLWALSFLENLCELTLSNVKYLGRDLQALKNLDKLKRLELPGVNLNGQEIAKFGCLPNLTHLTLSCEGFKDDDMIHFAQLKSVTSLTLCGRSISEKNFLYLKKMPKLQSIWLPNCCDLDKTEQMRIEKQLNGISIVWGHGPR